MFGAKLRLSKKPRSNQGIEVNRRCEVGYTVLNFFRSNRGWYLASILILLKQPVLLYIFLLDWRFLECQSALH